MDALGFDCRFDACMHDAWQNSLIGRLILTFEHQYIIFLMDGCAYEMIQSRLSFSHESGPGCEDK